MSNYESIFTKKTNLLDVNAFIRRIYDLICMSEHGFNFFKILDTCFISKGVGFGYSSISDFIKSIYGDEAYDIFKAPTLTSVFEDDTLVFANIEAYVNSIEIYTNRNTYIKKQYSNIYRAFSNFLIQKGYQLYQNDNHITICQIDLPVKVNEIKNEEIKNDLLSYYNYVNNGDIYEKRKILTSLVQKLEIRKSEITDLFGKSICKTYGLYSNKFHIRHNDGKQVDGLTDLELENWYDFIYGIFIKLYVNLDVLKKVDIKE